MLNDIETGVASPHLASILREEDSLTKNGDHHSERIEQRNETGRFQQWDREKITWKSLRDSPLEFQILAAIGFLFCIGFAVFIAGLMVRAIFMRII